VEQRGSESVEEAGVVRAMLLRFSGHPWDHSGHEVKDFSSGSRARKDILFSKAHV
jgi:hypothetical protein